MRRSVIIGVASAVFIGVGVYAYVQLSSDTVQYETAVVSRRDMQEEVSVTGEVKPTEEVLLAFEVGGKVAAVNADVGDVVARGQILASLDSSAVSAQLQASRAAALAAQSVAKEYELALESELARLDELKLGTRPEEIFVSQTKLVNARQALTGAESNLAAVKQKGAQDLDNLYLGASDVLNEAYVHANDALVKYTDVMFSNSFSSKNELVFIVLNQENKLAAENSRGDAYFAVETFSKQLLSVSATHAQVDASLSAALAHLAVVQKFLSDLNIALSDSHSVDPSTLSTYKANVSTARTNVVGAISSINKQIQSISAQKATNAQNVIVAENQLSDAQNAVLLAQSELSLKESGTLPEQIRAQEAKVSQAQTVLQSQQARVNQAWADVQRVTADLADYALTSPLNGIITRMDVRAGEIVGANVQVITVISQAAYEIIANVPEADIAKVKVGDMASLTLDAYTDRDVFMASVVKIDPAQTKIEGVTTYKVTLQFAAPDERVRSGMTANVVLVTARRNSALAIPQRAIIRRNGDQMVRVLLGETVVEQAVTTGLMSPDGFVEITGGLQQNDIVITSVKE